MLTPRNAVVKKVVNFPINNKFIKNNKSIINNKKYNIQQMQNNKTIKYICRYI
jgi:hypothetical protein